MSEPRERDVQSRRNEPALPEGPRRALAALAFWALLAACAVTFFVLAHSLAAERLGPFDAFWFEVVAALRGPALDAVVPVFTELGTGYGTLALLLVALVIAWRRCPTEAAYIAAATFGAGALNYVTKLAFARPRPEPLLEQLVSATGYAFPSGHAMGTSALVVSVAIALHHRLPHRRWLIWPLAALYGLAMGLSRVYLNVHFPSDVLAGWTFGAAWALGLNLLFVRHRGTCHHSR